MRASLRNDASPQRRSMTSGLPPQRSRSAVTVRAERERATDSLENEGLHQRGFAGGFVAHEEK